VADLVSVTIGIPAPGYIVLQADGQHGIYGNGVDGNEANFTIKDVSGGGFDAAYWFVSGFSPSSPTPAPTGLTRLAVSIHRTYFENAGTYTFYFQANANDPAALGDYIWDPTITATYYPTSYGTVSTFVSSNEAAKLQLAGKPAPRGGASPEARQARADGVQVDLRELELRAARLKAQSEAADRALLEARLKGVLQIESASHAPGNR